MIAPGDKSDEEMGLSVIGFFGGGAVGVDVGVGAIELGVDVGVGAIELGVDVGVGAI
jgi:hypothetical protein